MRLSGFQFGRRRASWRIFAAAFLLAIVFVADAKAQNRALIISLDSYADPRLAGSPSGLAENDAASIRKLLVEKLGYKPEQIKTLSNKQATKAAILSTISKWLGPESPDDAEPAKLKGVDESGAMDSKKTAKKKRRTKRKKRKPRHKTFRSYLYFSGLGTVQTDTDGDEKDGLDETLIPFDATLAEVGGEDRISGMITDDELSEAVGKFVGRHTTLVFDTSHTGPPTRSQNPEDGKEISNLRSPGLNGPAGKIREGSGAEPYRQE
ncbi:MAG: caspase family protein, partial [Methyloligellaceae bacterium]